MSIINQYKSILSRIGCEWFFGASYQVPPPAASGLYWSCYWAISLICSWLGKRLTRKGNHSAKWQVSGEWNMISYQNLPRLRLESSYQEKNFWLGQTNELQMLTQLDTRAMPQNFSTLHISSLKRTNLQHLISGIYIYIHVYGWHLVLFPAISGSFLSALHDLESKCWKS
jgi:hypothetical protein